MLSEAPSKVIIVTALPVERAAVARHLTDTKEVRHPTGSRYLVGRFQSLNVTVAQIAPGNSSAALETERMITRSSPDLALFVGVAGGVKDVMLGDVVAATKVYGYESGADREIFQPRPEVGLASYPLIQVAVAVAREGQWIVRARFHSPGKESKAFVAPIAAGSKVVKSSRGAVALLLRQSYGDALAVEMEGEGFMRAAYTNRVDAIIVRGVSDLLDGKTEADRAGSQESASDHAAAFAFELLAKLAGQRVQEVAREASRVEWGGGIAKGASVLWTRLRELAPRLYPRGPDENRVWEDAGGDLSGLNLSENARTQWSRAIRLLEEGGGNLSVRNLLDRMLRDFGGNYELQYLRAELDPEQPARRSDDDVSGLFSAQNQSRQPMAQTRLSNPEPLQVRPQNLPYVSLGELFKGREPFMAKLRECLLAQCRQNDARSATWIRQRPQTVYGLGGVGKTRLAVEYGWRHASEYNAVLFVVADSSAVLHRNIAQLAGPLVLNLPEWNRPEEEVTFAAAIRWLLEHPGWFLILDNVDTKGAAQAAEELIARIPGGHVLITSRLEDWNKDVQTLELGVIAAEDATSFLLERTLDRRRVTAADRTDAASLSYELDGLALALEQAGAFIERQRCSIGDYLQRWRTGEERVRKWFDPVTMHYPASVAITYDTTMREVGPTATAFFRILSWFAPDPLPEAVAASGTARNILAQMIKPKGEQEQPVYPDEALAELGSFCMIKKVEVQGVTCISQHRLIRDLTQRQIPQAETASALRNAVSIFAEFAPKDAFRFEVWKEWRLLIPHAEALWGERARLDHTEWDLPLMEGLALYYLGQNRYADAISIQEKLLQEKRARLGDEDGQVCLVENDLALMLDLSGDKTRAQALYRGALAQWEKIGTSELERGPAEAAHNLGNSLTNTGDLKEAESILQKALGVFQRKSGPYHWRTLMAEFSLAGMLQAKGESDEAIRLLRGNIEKKTSHLQEGADHPDTLDSMMLLATILLAQGVTEEAENLAVRIIEGRGRSLGPDDTGTLEAVKLLLNIYLKAGKNEKVAALQDRITDSSIRTGDSAQLGSVRQVAYQFYISGEYGRAERILRALVEKRFEVASNWCHLARIFIIEDRVSDAEDVVASAWEFRSGTPAYVVPRVLWLRLALLRLTGDGSESWPSWHLLGLIKTVLTASGAFESWTMDPVMEHLKGKLPGHDRELLAALVSAFSNSSSLADLDGFPEWRNQPPVPLDEFHLTTRGAQTLD